MRLASKRGGSQAERDAELPREGVARQFLQMLSRFPVKEAAVKLLKFLLIFTAVVFAAGLWGLGLPNNAAALEGKPTGWCTDSSGRVFRCDEEPEEKTPDAPCRLGYRPQMVRAEPIRHYHAGPYEAVLFGEIEAAGRVQYIFVLEVAKADYPCLYVASEINSLGSPGKGPYFLGVFSGEGHGNLGLSDDWGDIDLFEAKGLELVRQYLGADLEKDAAPPWEKP